MTSTFPATRWSIVAAAATGDPATAHTALGELCRVYWYPLYAFARRKGLGPEDAEDATQSFLLSVLQNKLFASADPSLGRLRTFLLTAFTRSLANARRHAASQKRGGGIRFVAFDSVEAEDRFLAAPCGDDANARFDSDWAVALLDATMAKVETDYAATSRGTLFQALRPLLGTTGDDPPDHAAIAATLGMSRAAVRQAVARLRDRFRTALRAQIADTLQEPTASAIDEELHALRAVLALT